MDYPITIPLGRSIEVDGQTFHDLKFDEPDLGTSIAVEEAESAHEQTVLLLAGMADVDRTVILKLKESDYRTIHAKVLEPYQAQITAQNAGATVGNETPPKPPET